jgi:hypothetical protein
MARGDGQPPQSDLTAARGVLYGPRNRRGRNLHPAWAGREHKRRSREAHLAEGGSVETDEDGAVTWRDAQSRRHRDGGPAIEHADGTQEWYRDGQRHRDDGPAIELTNGTGKWYRDGQRHRERAPAVECTDGSRGWWLDGKRHRDEGAAVERASGTREWYRDGQRHRDDGPAIEHADGTQEWWRDGQRHRDDAKRREQGSLVAAQIKLRG